MANAPPLMQGPDAAPAPGAARGMPSSSVPPSEMSGEESGISPEEQEIFESFVAGLREHIFGPAEEGIRKQLRESQNLAQDIGSLAYVLVNEGGSQADEAGVMADMDMMMGVAAQIIDDLLEMAEAMGVIEEDQITDDLRFECLGAAINTYLTTGNPGPEEQEAAMAMLQQMQDNGMVDEATGYVAERGKAQGIDPFAEG